MDMERAVPILPAEDLAVAKAFFVDGLGFRVTFEASDDGHAGLLGLERGTIQLTLDCPMDGHGRNACVSLHVEDADAYYREWSRNVSVLRAPKDETWGARTFDLLDPSGNTIFVIGPCAPSNAGRGTHRAIRGE
jgi:catechol 2,3-dioxygenase-like lactoylglutathione lyase family enzyme